MNAVSLTLQNDSNGTDQGDYRLPLCGTYTGFDPGEFLYISAQIIQPTSGAGKMKCEIWFGSDLISTASASGFANIATCSGTVP